MIEILPFAQALPADVDDPHLLAPGDVARAAGDSFASAFAAIVAFDPRLDRLYTAEIHRNDGGRYPLFGEHEHGRVVAWDLPSGRCAEVLDDDGVTRALTATSLPDVVVTGDGSGTIRAWNVSTGERLFTASEGQSEVFDIAVSSDARRVAWGQTNKVFVRDFAAHGPTLKLEGHSKYVSKVAFSPAGSRLVSIARERKIRLWDPAAGASLGFLEGHTSWVSALAFAPDGMLASGAHDCTVRLWDLAGRREIGELPPLPHTVSALRFSPGGRTLAIGCDDGTARLVDLRSGETTRELRVQEGMKPHEKKQYGVHQPIGFSPTLRWAWSVNAQHVEPASRRVSVWDLHTGDRLFEMGYRG